GDDRQIYRLSQGPGGFDIDPPFHPVPGDVGIDQGRGPQGFQGFSHFQGGAAAALGPALHRQQAVPGIQANGDAPGKAGAGPGRQLRVLEDYGAQDQPVQPQVKVGADGLQGADAAPQLHEDGEIFPQAPDGLQILGAAGKGPVQVHHVEPTGPGRLPLEAGGHRVVGEYRHLLGPALAQAYALAVSQVDGRNNQHIKMLTQLTHYLQARLRMAHPAGPSALTLKI